MRRPDKAAGVIRPRTLGLGRPAAPEPLPPPPPQASPFASLSNGKLRIVILVGLVCLLFLYVSKKSEQSGLGLPDVDTDGQSESLRSIPEDGELEEPEKPEDDDEPEHGGNTKKHAVIDEEDSDESSDSEEDAVEETEPDEDDDNLKQSVESAKPISSASKGGDRTRSIESYFTNFGGRVVEIDKEGSYKYVLIRMEDVFGKRALIVRACPHKEGTHCKHGDAYARGKAELDMRGYKSTVLGGGRITRHPSRHQRGQKEGYVSIFGYSKTFGACDDCNKLACSLIKAALPDHGVKWANEGYLESDERKVRDESWTRC